MGKEKFLCPSAPMCKGSKLLGIVNAENEIDIIEKPIDIDNGFTESASKGRAPEQRFRFVNSCVKEGCQQWDGSSCSVVKIVLDKIEKKNWKNELPVCGIRDECRWFTQEGANACKVCTLVKYKY
jgi:hypothetical protein